MEFKELHYGYTVSAARCIKEIISPLSIYSQDARTTEINKYNSDTLWTFVSNKGRCNLVAIDNGEVVGFLFGVVDAHVMFISWIGMKDKYTRSGHMESLWSMMEEWGRQHNIHKVWCDTNQLNVPAITFMQKMGMTNCGDLKNFWYGHDYFLWEKQLHG